VLLPDSRALGTCNAAQQHKQAKQTVVGGSAIDHNETTGIAVFVAAPWPIVREPRGQLDAIAGIFAVEVLRSNCIATLVDAWCTWGLRTRSLGEGLKLFGS